MSEKTNHRPCRWPLAWQQWAVLAIAVVALAVNGSFLAPPVEQDLSTIRYNLHRNEEERLELREPETVRYCRFVREHVPEDKTVGVPIKGAVPWPFGRLTQTELLQALLFPRRVIPIVNRADLERVDAIVTAGDFPKGYPRDGFIPYPVSDRLLRATLYVDGLQLTDREGRLLYADSFELDASLEGSTANLSLDSGQPAKATSGSRAFPRFRFWTTDSERFRVLGQKITPERAKVGKKSEVFTVEIEPWKDAWFSVRIDPIPVREIKELKLWVWATHPNLVRVGLVFEDKRFIRSLRNRNSYAWEELGFEDLHASLEKDEYEDYESFQVVAIAISLMDYDWCPQTGLILKSS